ncbi:MAG: hypothetical protein WCD86_19110, partial [Ktedonobacteraceae bacterium]
MERAISNSPYALKARKLVLYSDPRCQDKQIGVAKVYSPFLMVQSTLPQAFDSQELGERAAH